MAARRKRGKRQPNGRLSQSKASVASRAAESAEDVLAVAKTARLRALAAIDRQATETFSALDPMAGLPIGRVIMFLAPREEWAALWQAAQQVVRVVRNYDAAMLCSRHPKGGRILAPSEALATSADAPPWDDRSDEERYAAAVRARDSLKAALDSAGYLGFAATVEAVLQTEGTIARPRAALAALRCIGGAK